MDKIQISTKKQSLTIRLTEDEANIKFKELVESLIFSDKRTGIEINSRKITKAISENNKNQKPANMVAENKTSVDIGEMTKNKKRVDIGKMQALKNAGWSVAKIADEIGVSQQTVYNHLKRAEQEI